MTKRNPPFPSPKTQEEEWSSRLLPFAQFRCLRPGSQAKGEQKRASEGM